MVKKFLKQFKQGQKGFTLIELLVVVAILGVLAAVAIPNVARFINSGQEEADSTELANVQTAVVAAMAEAHTGTAPVEVITDATTTGNDAEGNAVFVVDFIVGGIDSLSRSYEITNPDGSVAAVVEAEEP